jgi:hypothetical protein
MGFGCDEEFQVPYDAITGPLPLCIGGCHSDARAGPVRTASRYRSRRFWA